MADPAYPHRNYHTKTCPRYPSLLVLREGHFVEERVADSGDTGGGEQVGEAG